MQFTSSPTANLSGPNSSVPSCNSPRKVLRPDQAACRDICPSRANDSEAVRGLDDISAGARVMGAGVEAVEGNEIVERAAVVEFAGLGVDGSSGVETWPNAWPVGVDDDSFRPVECRIRRLIPLRNPSIVIVGGPEEQT
jgi:hypothetical protein